jgi:copper chaperone
MRDTRLEIRDVHCDSCAARIESLLEREPGVRGAEVRLAEGHARVRYNEHAISEARLREVIENGGFEASSSA